MLGHRYIFTYKDIQFVCRCSRRTAYARIQKWIELGVVKRLGVFLVLTRQGLYEAGLPYKYREFKQIVMPHMADVNCVERKLRERTDMLIKNWETERQIRNRCGLRDEETPYDKVHIPDAIADIVIDGAPWNVAIEVERTKKSTSRIDEILRTLVQNYAVTWYFANAKAYDAIKEGIKRLPTQEERNRIGLWHLEPMTGEAVTTT